MQFNTRKYRGAIAIASLVSVMYGGGFSATALMRLIGPLNLGTQFEDRPLLALTVFMTGILGVFVFVLLLFFSDWVVWLVLMKPLYSKSEMSTYLGFELAGPGWMKRICKRVFNLIY